MYKDYFYTSERTQCASIRKTNLGMLYAEIITISCQDHINSINAMCAFRAKPHVHTSRTMLYKANIPDIFPTVATTYYFLFTIWRPED